MPRTCLWCGSDVWKPGALSVREMMFGTRDEFRLLTCSTCGSLALADPPDDPVRYYPDNYYSFESTAADREFPAAVRLAARAGANALLRLPAPVVDRALARSRVSLGFFRWFAGRGVRTNDSVLDVGSGDGFQLKVMALFGFSRLLGVDPYLGEELAGPPMTLRRDELGDVGGSFDVVMAHHVLEHVTEPRTTLRQVAERLADGGTAIVRLPLADSYAARHYGADWVQLDSPRHLTVPTEAGVRSAATAAGLRVVRAFRDGTAFGLWGSEQYVRDIPLRGERSWLDDRENSPFTETEMGRWEALARVHNREGVGDQGCFVLTHVR